MFLDEIAAKIVAEVPGIVLGGANGNLFLSSASKIPPGAGPYTTLTETGGAAVGGFRGGGGRIQNDTAVHIQKPGAQILTRATTYAAARARAKEIFLCLDGTWNETLSGVFYQQITARQEPTDLGVDEAGRVVVVFNIDAMKQPS